MEGTQGQAPEEQPADEQTPPQELPPEAEEEQAPAELPPEAEPGQPLERPGGGAFRPKGRASGMSIAAMLLSILGLIFVPTAIIGLVLGAVEYAKIRNGRSPAAGRNFALAGIIIGAVVILLAIILTVLSLTGAGTGVDTSTTSTT